MSRRAWILLLCCLGLGSSLVHGDVRSRTVATAAVTDVQSKQEEKVIEDPALEQAILQQLSLTNPTGVERRTIQPKDLLGLVTLDARSSRIRSIKGLEHAIHLRSLDLSDNEIVGVEALATCESLVSLNISNNRIVDVSPLFELEVVLTPEFVMDGNPIPELQLQTLAVMKEQEALRVQREALRFQQLFAEEPVIDVSSYSDEQEVVIADAALRRALLNQTGKEEGQLLTPRDLAGITKLKVQGQQVGSLQGLEYAVNLRELNVERNAIRDLSPLAELRHLRSLYASDNDIRSLQPIARLVGLTALGIDNNPLGQEELEQIRGLTQLEFLHANGLGLTHLHFMMNMHAMRYLFLDQNQISSLVELRNMPDLYVVWIRDNRVSDLTPLLKLRRLDELRLNGNPLYVEASVSLERLRRHHVTLYMDPLLESDPTKRPLSYTSVIADPNLEHAIRLELGKLQGDLTASDLRLLVSLYPKEANKPVSTLQGLEHATNMTALLFAEKGTVTDLEPIRALTKLTFLSLPSGGVRDLSPIGDLPVLARLVATNSRIVDLGPLSRRAGTLTDLLISGNEIESMEPLRNCVHLTWLDVTNNRIRDLSPVRGMTSLETLYVARNQVADLSPLLEVPSLTKVVVSGNPLSQASAEVIRTLRARGVTVEEGDDVGVGK